MLAIKDRLIIKMENLMKKIVSKILVIILTASTVSQAVSAPLLGPKRWFECMFDPEAKGVNKKKCSKEEKKKAIVGSIIGGATVGTVAAAGPGGGLGAHRYAKGQPGGL